MYGAPTIVSTSDLLTNEEVRDDGATVDGTEGIITPIEDDYEPVKDPLLGKMHALRVSLQEGR